MTRIYGSPDYAMGDIYGSPDYALGATASSDAVKLLQQQVNRFVPSLFSTPIQVSGVMSYELGAYAAAVLLDRAKRALATFGAQEPAAGFYHKAYAAALARSTAPMPWAADNLEEVTQEVARHANFLGLPGAGGTFARLVSDWRVWAVGIGGVALYYMNKRKR